MEEKIKELEKRLEKLERIERRRKSIVIAKVVGIILLIIAIITGGYILYLKVEETLEPFKELIETKDNVTDSVNSGIDTAKDAVNSGVDTVKDLFNK